MAEPNAINRQALSALFSVDYHVALLRAKAAHAGYKDWAVRAERVPEIDALAPGDPRDAISRIASLSDSDRYRRHAA